jgi:hypothetical protein
MKNSYYSIGGMTILVNLDIAITDQTFDDKFKSFEVDENPEAATVFINHHLSLPFTKVNDLGKNVYFKSPWGIYKKDDSWIYVSSYEKPVDDGWNDMAIFSSDYTHGDFYHRRKETFERGHWDSLTFFPTDQILIAQLLADREGVYLHSGAVILEGAGLMFVGHSSAGKSTTMNMLKDRAEILCDDRNIARHYPDGFRVFGTWSHGEVSKVSGSSAPLKAILFLKQSENNRLIPLEDKKDIRFRLIACLIKPFMTVKWWDKSMDVIEKIADEVPCYEMEFDKSGAIVQELVKLVEGQL